MTVAKASIIDRILKEVAPGLAADRLANKNAFNDIQARGYSGALDTRNRTHRAWNRSMPQDEDTLVGSYDRLSMALECRDLWRNNEIVRGLVDRYVQYSIWQGIWPMAKTSSDEWNDTAEAWWKQIYVPTADARQQAGVNLIDFQRLCVSHRMLDGDLGFVMLKNGQLQPIESGRITTPKDKEKDTSVIQGVKRDSQGRIRGYYVSPRSNGKIKGTGGVDNKTGKFYSKENFIFCHKPIRIDQVRGIPDLAPVIDKLRDYDETDLAVMNKVKMDAQQQFKRFKKSSMEQGRNRGGYQLTDGNSKNPQLVEKQDAMVIHNLQQGEDLESFNSVTPNQQYVPYLKHELQAIAAAMGIPYEFLMLIFTEGSFSSNRAALIHARQTFLCMHQWVIDSFMNRLWNWRIALAIKNGDLPPAPTDPTTGISEWWKKDWSMPYFGWVDPEKEAKANLADFNMGVTSLQAISKERGRERNDVFSEKAGDIRQAMTVADGLNAEGDSADVSWRDIISTSIPGQVTKEQAPAKKED